MRVGVVGAAGRRERELAGDVRAGSWARARARQKQRDFLCHNWRRIAGFTAFMVVIGALVCLVTTEPFLEGLIVGVILATVPAVIWSLTVQLTGTGPVMMGDQAEQWTAQELRKLRRHGWRLVNHFLLRRGDIDHVLIGPAGVWVVETKWSSSWEDGFAQARLHDAVAQVASSARSMRLWSPVSKLGLRVRPVVVLWGGGLSSAGQEAQIHVIDGVPIVKGHSLVEWMAAMPGDVLDSSGIEEAWHVVESRARERDGLDREANPIPLSFADYLVRAATAVVGCVGAVEVMIQIWTHAPSTVWSLTFSLLAFAPAYGLIRVRSLRPLIWGWVAGVGLMVAAVVVLSAVHALT